MPKSRCCPRTESAVTANLRIPLPEERFGDAEEAQVDSLDESLQAGMRFMETFKRCFPGAEISGRVLDLGCRSALTGMAFAQAFPTCRIDGVDNRASLLGRGRRRIAEASLQGRITLIEGRLPEARLSRERYQVVLSRHLLHRLEDGGTLWQTARRHGASGAMVMATDLRRPQTQAQAAEALSAIAGSATGALANDLRERFAAAYEVSELETLLEQQGCGELQVRPLDEYQLVVWGVLGSGR